MTFKYPNNLFVFDSSEYASDDIHCSSNFKKYIKLKSTATLTSSVESLLISGSSGLMQNRFEQYPITLHALWPLGVATSGSSIFVSSIKETSSNVWSSVILSSSDQGYAWSVLSQSNYTGTVPLNLFDVVVNSTGTIFAQGDDGGNVIIRSSSNGQSWSNVLSYNQNLTSIPGASYYKASSLAIDSQDKMILGYQSLLDNTLHFLTSSSKGISGSWLDVNFFDAGSTTQSIAHSLIISGTSFFAGVGTFPLIVSGSLDGNDEPTICYGVLSETAITGARIKKFFLDNKLWALGGSPYNIPIVLTSSNGKLGTWATQSSAQSLCRYAVNDMFKDRLGHYWMLTGQHTSGQILRSVDNGENWTVFEEREDICWRQAAQETTYGGIVLIGVSGNFGLVSKLYPYSTNNFGSSSISTTTPRELFFGFPQHEGQNTAFQIPPDICEKYLKDLRKQNVLSPSLNLADISFQFSGNFSDIREISVKDASGAFTTLTSSYVVSASSNVSSTFSTLYMDPNMFPERAAYLRMKISSSIGSNVSISNVKINYEHPLTDDGVNFFNQVDNQNFQFTNRRLTKKLNLSSSYAEFPHSLGVFQMPNIIKGTTSAGQLGQTDDSIIQVKHFGSVVHVMWPKQDNSTTFSKGFGDYSAGQKPGRLTTNFVLGETIDVTKYDHLSLYCYLKKVVSGTLDDIELTIQRRPLDSVAFATEQSIDYAVSGSVVAGTLRDLYYKKEINYGDLSIAEIGFPIDVPLVNTRDICISAKQKNGQASVDNTNFIIWGRLINSETET